MSGEAKIRTTTFENAREINWLEREPRVTVLVGKNGVGKSRILKSIAKTALRLGHKIIVVSNTPTHSFDGLRGAVQRLISGRQESSPQKVLKGAIRQAEASDQVALRRIARIFTYCGYSPEIGISVKIASSKKRGATSIELLEKSTPESAKELLSLAELLIRGSLPREPVWFDFDRLVPDYSHRSLLTRVILWEDVLKRAGIVSSINLSLRKGGSEFPLRRASSGELSIISTAAFLTAHSSDVGVLLIDEPENSLHPAWQREYIGLLGEILKYRETRIYVATHSPLILSELSEGAGLPLSHEVFVLTTRQKLRDTEVIPNAIDAVMLEAFDILTPQSRYFSEVLIKLLEKLDKGQMELAQVKVELDSYRARGADHLQQDALKAVEAMAMKIVSEKSN